MTVAEYWKVTKERWKRQSSLLGYNLLADEFDGEFERLCNKFGISLDAEITGLLKNAIGLYLSTF